MDMGVGSTNPDLGDGDAPAPEDPLEEQVAMDTTGSSKEETHDDSVPVAAVKMEVEDAGTPLLPALSVTGLPPVPEGADEDQSPAQTPPGGAAAESQDEDMRDELARVESERMAAREQLLLLSQPEWS